MADSPKSRWRHAVRSGFNDVLGPVLGVLDLIGDHLILVGRAFAWLFRRPVRWRNYLEAAEYIGFGSLPIVLFVGLFTGMVVALQSVITLGTFSGGEIYAGGATGKALALELGPVLTALMLAGRAGSGIATELGTMRISEQIDALESMAVNPIQYLVLPRLVVGILLGPMLTLLFFIVGMAGAYYVGVINQHIAAGPFVAKALEMIKLLDVVQGLIKSSVFGFLVTLIGSYQGMNAKGGGRGVGIGTTRAVVIASVTILVSDYFLTDVLLRVTGTR